MPIEAYLPTSGASFGPEAVARFIIKLAEIDGGVDAASLRDKAVMALDGSIHLASLSKDGQPDASRS
jgi:hypothetical protein